MTVPKVSGGTTVNGTRWVRISHGSRVVFEQYQKFAYEAAEIKKRLAYRGIVLVKKAEWAGVLAKVEDLESFPRRNWVEQTGWTNDLFALPDGTVPGAKDAVALFEPASYVGSEGTMDDWLTHVAEPLIGQKLLSFLLMTALAPPILRLTDREGNFGFEIVGKGGCGKSTALRLMASTCGPATSADGNNFWTSLNATMAGL